MTVVEELVSVLGVEIGSEAMSTLAKFKSAVSAGMAGAGAVVAALGAAFAGTVVSVADLGIETQKTALRLGVTTDAVQELRYAADLSNVSFESLTIGMRFLSKNAAEAAAGTGQLSDYFKGIPLRDVNGRLKTADELLVSLSTQFNKVKDPIAQTDLAVRLLGRSGSDLIPLLKQGPDGIHRLAMEAHDLGYVLDEKTIKSSMRFNTSLKHMKAALLGIRNTLGAPFIDDFSDGLDWLTERIYNARVWFHSLTEDIRDLGQRFKKVGELAKAAFGLIRKFITDMRIDKIGEAVDALHLFEAALIGLGVIAGATALATAASWLIAAAPFILLAVLIGLIVEDIAGFVKGQDSVLGRAEKWAKAFDPDDSPMIKFFKSALQYLLDLGDPAKWNRVRDAARNALHAMVYGDTADEHIKNNGGVLLDGQNTQNEIPESVAQPDVGHRLLRSIGIHNKTKFYEKPGIHGSGKPLADDAWVRMTMEANRKEAVTHDLGNTPMPEAAITQKVEINIHGATDPDKTAQQVREVLDQALSDAKAAIKAHPGGS